MAAVNAAFMVAPTKLKLERGGPPEKTVKKPGYGEYCIRAESFMYRDDDSTHPILKVTGYDTSMDIVQTVTDACDRNAKGFGLECTPCSVVIMPNSQMLCSGIHFTPLVDEVDR